MAEEKKTTAKKKPAAKKALPEDMPLWQLNELSREKYKERMAGKETYDRRPRYPGRKAG